MTETTYTVDELNAERLRLIDVACDLQERLEELETKLAGSEKVLKAARRENEGLRGKLQAQGVTLNRTKRELLSAQNDTVVQRHRADQLGRQVQSLSREMNDILAEQERNEPEVPNGAE